MGLNNKFPVSERYRAPVDKLCRDVANGVTTLKKAAVAHNPIVALIAYMRIQGVSQVVLADRLGVSQALVSLWLSGKTKPSLQQRQGLKALCSIPADHWDDAGSIW